MSAASGVQVAGGSCIWRAAPNTKSGSVIGLSGRGVRPASPARAERFSNNSPQLGITRAALQSWQRGRLPVCLLLQQPDEVI
jgi:hypothetical protein